MLKRLNLSAYIVYALIAAAGYIIPTYFFLKSESYENAWLLFLGNCIFMFCIFGFVILYNRRKSDNANTVSTMTAAHIDSILAVVIIFVVLLLMVLFWFRGLGNPEASKSLVDTPPNMIRGNTNGMLFMLLLDATLGNLVAGFFVSIITAYTAKRDQTKERMPANSLDLNKR